MTLAYLTNQYPAVSHSFIRREIAALECLGLGVERSTLRKCARDLPDPADQREVHRAKVILEGSSVWLLLSALRHLLRGADRFLPVLTLAVRFGLRSRRGVAIHLAYLAEALVLTAWCRKRGIDHRHAHFGTNPAMVALLTRKLGGPSYSFTAHGDEPFDSAEWVGLEEKIAGAEFVVGISNFGVARLQRYCVEGQSAKVHRIRCGIDQSFFGSPQVPIPKDPRLVFVGRLCEVKAPENLLLATRDLVEDFPELQCIVVGQGPLEIELQAQAKALGISDRINWLGACSGAEVREAIQSARALVVTSSNEGLPVVIMEAFALGRPVVSTSVAGISELVEPGVNGWLVPAGSIPALRAALGEVLGQETERLEAMAARGKEKVRVHHDVMNEAAKLKDLFARYVPEPTLDEDRNEMARKGYPPEIRRRLVNLVEGGRKVSGINIELGVSEQSLAACNSDNCPPAGRSNTGSGPDAPAWPRYDV